MLHAYVPPLFRQGIKDRCQYIRLMDYLTFHAHHGRVAMTVRVPTECYRMGPIRITDRSQPSIHSHLDEVGMIRDRGTMKGIYHEVSRPITTRVVW